MNMGAVKIIVSVCLLMLFVSSTAIADRDKRDRAWRDKDDRQTWQKAPKQESNSSKEWQKAPKQQFTTDKDWQKAPKDKFIWEKRDRVDRQYPKDGRIFTRLPERRYPIYYRDRTYFFFDGIWYLPSGPNYVVVRPPIGVIVPILPDFYTTVWYYGTPYYYANDIYYVWRPDLNGYQVSEPPQIENESEPTYMADELFIYPMQGQSDQQKSDDRYACHRWGVEQTGYDPTQPPGNLTTVKLQQLRADYQRAMKACLEGRGYSVK